MGLRRLPPGFWVRLGSGWKIGIASGAGAMVCIGAGLAFASAVNFMALVLALVASAVVGMFAAHFHGKSELLPDRFVDEIENEPSFRAEFCTADVLREACDLTRDSYGHEYVSHNIAEQWRLRNPRAFVQIMNPDNRLCAAFGILALRESFMDQFIAGRVTNQQLLGEDVCSWSDSKKCSRLYISGVVVLQPSTLAGPKRAHVMLWVMLEYMRRLYGLKKHRRLYAIAVTRQSHRLMRKLGFEVEVPAARRTDQCDLYRYELTEATWKALLHRVGDLSPMCSFDSTLPTIGRGRRTVPSDSSAESRKARSGKPAQTTILFVAGDRGGFTRNLLQIPKELKAVKTALRGCNHRGAFRLATPMLGATRQDFVAAYRERPAILHFAGHGDDRSLSFILDQGSVASETPVIAEQLVKILGCFEARVRLCVLNACASEPIAKLLVERHVVDAAVGWPGKVTDSAAINFSSTLYGCLGDGQCLSTAVTLAAQSYDSAETPIIYSDEGINPDVYTFIERTAE